MLSRGAALGGLFGSSNEVCALKRARPSARPTAYRMLMAFRDNGTLYLGKEEPDKTVWIRPKKLVGRARGLLQDRLGFAQ
jgi:hypothetical protein